MIRSGSTPSGPYGAGGGADAADLAALLRASPGAVYQCVRGTDGRILWVRQEGELAESWGLTTPDVAGRLVEDLFPRETLRAILPWLERAFAGQEVAFEHASRGRILRHVARPRVAQDGRVECVIGSIEDVTDVARADSDARVFASAVSHDLRAPLTSARNDAAMLRSRHAQRLDDEGRRHLARMDDALARMSGMMDELLRLAEASRVELDVREVEIGQIAADIAAILREREPHGKARVRVDELALAWGDERLVRMLVECVLTSAWNGAAGLTSASIEFGSARRSGATSYHVRVVGDGVDAGCAARLFQPPDASAGLGGAGLAIATVDSIVRRHGGRIWTEPLERGAAFCFTLADGWPSFPPAT